MANSITAKQTKSEIVTALAEDTDLTKKQVSAVLDSLAVLARRHLQSGGSGEFIVPSVGVKLRRVMKPARAARVGTNPATGQKITIAAKPETVAVRATPLKALKDVVV